MYKISLEGGKHTFEQYAIIDKDVFNINPAIVKMKPYDATNKSCQAIQLLKTNPELNKENVKIPEALDSATNCILRIFMPTDVQKWFRIVEIDEDLTNVIENTNNDIFHRKCFIDNIFINCDFSYKNYIIKGILVSDTSAKHVHTKVKTEGGYVDNNLIIMSMVFNTSTKEYGYIVTDLFSHADGVIIHIRTIICNILDLVTNNFNDVNVIDTANFTTRKNKTDKNREHTKHNKIFIKANGEFKTYARKFSKNNKCKHRFIVRGHFRHYRADRFNDELKKAPKWIRPYYKGEGIIIKKNYVVE